MQLEVVREIVEFLSDGTSGVVAQLATMPRDAGDAVPVNPYIVDGSKSSPVAQGDQFDRARPILLVVTPDGPVRYAGSAHIPKSAYSVATIPVAITLVAKEAREPFKQLQDAEYTLRAVMLSVAAYFAQRQDERIRNQIVILRAVDITAGLTQHDGTGGVGAVVFNIEAFDKRAQQG